MEFVINCDVEPLENVLSDILHEDITVDVVILPSSSKSFNMRADGAYIGSLVLNNDRRIIVQASIYIQERLHRYGVEIRNAISECWVSTV